MFCLLKQEHIKERQIILELFCDHWPLCQPQKRKRQRTKESIMVLFRCSLAQQTVLVHMKTVICNDKILYWKDCIQLEHINDSLVHFLFGWKCDQLLQNITKNAKTIYFGLCIIWLCTISACSVIWQSKIS